MLEAGCSTFVEFNEWTGARAIPTLGTNAGARELPFQGWRRFKEAFAPELIQIAAGEMPDAKTVVDPFGGSGTTALAAQFLGIHPTTIEVNPFLADLIEAKICEYDLESLVNAYAQVVDVAAGSFVDPSLALGNAPPTFVEPGVDGRYLFSRDVAGRITAFRQAIEGVADSAARRLLKVLLGAISVPVSNAVVSGKGRRYRRNWQSSQTNAAGVDAAFESAFLGALFDLRRYADRRCRSYRLIRGDARTALEAIEPTDLAIFSPPYPNSFDYTDVYNIELWMGGYLTNSKENRALRQATLRSHVQVKRDFSADSAIFCEALKRTLARLHDRADQLWDPNIPSMIAAYFDDLHRVLLRISRKMSTGGRVYMVVGDSRYAGIEVPVSTVLAQNAGNAGFTVVRRTPFRSMRTSPQQGGKADLAETLLVLERA